MLRIYLPSSMDLKLCSNVLIVNFVDTWTFVTIFTSSYLGSNIWVLAIKMRGWKCRDESEGMKKLGMKMPGMKVWGWKWEDKSVGMKMWGWKCRDEYVGMNMLGMKNLGMKKPGDKNRGWKWKDEKSGDEVSLSL